MENEEQEEEECDDSRSYDMHEAALARLSDIKLIIDFWMLMKKN